MANQRVGDAAGEPLVALVVFGARRVRSLSRCRNVRRKLSADVGVVVAVVFVVAPIAITTNIAIVAIVGIVVIFISVAISAIMESIVASGVVVVVVVSGVTIIICTNTLMNIAIVIGGMVVRNESVL